MAAKGRNTFDFTGSGVYMRLKSCAEAVSLMALPTVRVHEVPDEGLSLQCRVQPPELDLGVSDVPVSEDMVLDAQVMREGEAFGVYGTLSGTIVRQCVRCLKEYGDPCEVRLSAQFKAKSAAVAGPGRRKGAGAQKAPEDAELMVVSEVYVISGEVIDLAPMLREQVILGTPMQPLCREDCQGLCPRCGQDRNVRDCACAPEPRASPFAILRTLREQSGK